VVIPSVIGVSARSVTAAYADRVRVVSLLPSATEIVYALGADADLVGVTFECDEPPTARTDKAVVVSGLDTAGLTPGEIDEQVRSRMAAGADMYTLDAGALAGLDPDVILTQDLCRVCALPTDRVEDALEYLGGSADVVSLDPHTLPEVLDTIATIGARLGRGDQAARLDRALRARLAEIADRVADAPRPRVTVLEWVDPPFTPGHWVPDLVVAAGGTPIVGRSGGRSETTTWESISAAAPDVVIVAPCGFHLDAAAEQARPVVERFPGRPVWAIDADGLVVRPGPRLVDGVAALAAVFHPDRITQPPTGQVVRVA
jgi:iron complex transport system substrate-binding protein